MDQNSFTSAFVFEQRLVWAFLFFFIFSVKHMLHYVEGDNGLCACVCLYVCVCVCVCVCLCLLQLLLISSQSLEGITVWSL